MKPNVGGNIFILLEKHSNSENLHAFEYVKYHGAVVVMMCLSPRCSHMLRLLNAEFLGPVDTFYNRELTKWLKSHYFKLRRYSTHHTFLPFRLLNLDLRRVE